MICLWNFVYSKRVFKLPSTEFVQRFVSGAWSRCSRLFPVCKYYCHPLSTFPVLFSVCWSFNFITLFRFNGFQLKYINNEWIPPPRLSGISRTEEQPVSILNPLALTVNTSYQLIDSLIVDSAYQQSIHLTLITWVLASDWIRNLSIILNLIRLKPRLHLQKQCFINSIHRNNVSQMQH